ncbi:hypothetical protein PO909_001357 [Leuciscus waleckii]
MQSPSGTPLADVISSLAILHQEQHEALLDLKTDQERRFQAIVQAQQEDRKRFRSWMDWEVRAEATARQTTPTHLPLNKMGAQDEPEVFLDLFEKTAEAGGWPRDQWLVRLIPLLSGAAQVAAQQLPVRNLLACEDLQRVSVFGCVASVCSAFLYLVELYLQRASVFGCCGKGAVVQRGL